MDINTALEQFAQALTTGYQYGDVCQVERPKSVRTVEAYTGSVRRILNQTGLVWDSPSIESHLKRWRQHVGKQHIAGQVSCSKIRLDIAGLRKFYQWANSVKLVNFNPVSRMPGTPSVKRLPRPITAGDLEKLREVCKVTPESSLKIYRARALLECFMNGLRRIEAVRLNVENVYFEEGNVYARVMRKGGVIRDIPLNAGVASYLVAYIMEQHYPTWRDEISDNLLEVYSRWHQVVGGQWHNVPVFQHQGNRITPSKINRVFNAIKQKAGVSAPWGPHSLRHAFATRLLNNGVDIRVVQDLMAHAHITQTQLYTEVMNRTATNAVQLLNVNGLT